MEPYVSETLESLNRNKLNAVYAKDIDAARREVMELIPKGSTVAIGDSVTVRQLGVIEELQKGARVVINFFSRDIADAIVGGEISDQQVARVHRMSLSCEFYLTGSNVLTRDGKLINVDGAGNRVTGQIFGPERVILVVGVNKIVSDLEEGFERIRSVISPQHATTKNRRTPCVKEGRCVHCLSSDRICNVTGIIEYKPAYTDVTVIVVDEDLGLSWDKDWPDDRKRDICSAYEGLTWLKRPRER